MVTNLYTRLSIEVCPKTNLSVEITGQTWSNFYSVLMVLLKCWSEKGDL